MLPAQRRANTKENTPINTGSSTGSPVTVVSVEQIEGRKRDQRDAFKFGVLAEPHEWFGFRAPLVSGEKRRGALTNDDLQVHHAFVPKVKRPRERRRVSD
jgi:hypothetical protein